eukprot:gene9406-10389_t
MFLAHSFIVRIRQPSRPLMANLSQIVSMFSSTAKPKAPSTSSSKATRALRSQTFAPNENSKEDIAYFADEVSRLSQWTQQKNEMFNLHARYVSPIDLNYQLPSARITEIAFIGRSNVGKSSLIEALLGNQGLVRISKTPGCTRMMNFFALAKGPAKEPAVYFVDMPGYGFAKVAKAQRNDWEKVFQSYIQERDQIVLKRVMVLIDVRRGLQQVDVDFMLTLDAAALPYQVIFTKADLVSETEMHVQLNLLFCMMRRMKRSALYPFVHVVSSKTGEGMEDLKLGLAEILYDRFTLE